MKFVTYFLVHIFLSQVTPSGLHSRWQWSWSCVNETCVKSSTPNEVNGTTLGFCKVSCGKHGSLWPMPTGSTVVGKNLVFFHPRRIHFDYSQVAGGFSTRAFLEKVAKIFQNKLLVTCRPQCAVISNTDVLISFRVSGPGLKLDWETDESYALDISPGGSNNETTVLDIKIKASSVFGARHALETVTQLTASQILPSTPRDEKKGILAMVSSAQIIDSPAYPHRGLVLDTARHFISVPAIMRTIDAMSMTKLNALHWHATDTQSFPLETPRVPQMYSYGAYSPEQVYTVENIRAIIDYAKLRGVRIIMEIDGPAHAGNGWQWGETSNLGKLALCVNEQPWRKLCIQPPCGQLNPVNPNVAAVLKEVFADLIDMLPSGEVFHMGGDEVYFPCWNSSSEVVQWMSERNLRRDEDGFRTLWSEYQARVLKAFDERNPVENVPIVLWSSSLTEPKVIEKYLDKNRYIIETWLEASSPIPKQLLDKGYRLIMATKDKWYLDHGFWGKTVYHSWKAAYDNKLPQHPNVLGGEGAMWSERVDDYSLDVKIWPRMGAIGERLWTNPRTGSSRAETRFETFRDRLTTSGISADATSPYYCYQNEQECS